GITATRSTSGRGAGTPKTTSWSFSPATSPPSTAWRTSAGWRSAGGGGGCAVTESEWAACRKPDLLLQHLRGLPSRAQRGRRARLFVGGCCQLAWDHLDPAAWGALDTAERFAGGLTTREKLNSAINRVRLLGWREGGPKPLPFHLMMCAGARS